MPFAKLHLINICDDINERMTNYKTHWIVSPEYIKYEGDKNYYGEKKGRSQWGKQKDKEKEYKKGQHD